MKKVVVSLVSAAALATITAGMAAPVKSTVASSQDNNYQSYYAGKDSGFYVSGNLGWGRITGNTFAAASANFADKQRNGFAYGADLGYQFNPFAAVELGYLHINQFKDLAAVTHNASTIYLAAKGIYPINDQLDVFGKAGVARMNDSVTTDNTSSDTHKYVPVIGAGVAYNVNENVSVTMQDLYTFKSSKFTVAGASYHMDATNSILAGVTYKFNDLV